MVLKGGKIATVKIQGRGHYCFRSSRPRAASASARARTGERGGARKNRAYGKEGLPKMNTGASIIGRGAFILFEGVDRCGKSTQCKLLVQNLQSKGIAAELWRYPDRTTAIGQMIDKYLQSQTEMDDASIHLLFSANRWEKRKLMLEKLISGVTLVIDRYGYSGTAFTASKNVPGLDLEWCKSTDAGLPAPDALIYLEMPIEETLKRDGFGGERYEKTEFQKLVKENYERLSQGESWHYLDANKTIEKLQEEALKIALSTIDECKDGKALGKLWNGIK